MELDQSTDKYVILNGQHRFEAAKRAGIEALFCNIYSGITDDERRSLRANPDVGKPDSFLVIIGKYSEWVILFFNLDA